MLALMILCVSFFNYFVTVYGSPLMMRDVFSPHITSPDANTIWPVGTKQTVTWETDNIPPDSQLTDPNGLVVLGHLGSTGGLNLDLDNPLAQNFKLRAGEVQITVPSVPPRDDYIIVLFGDSGNSSPAFAITRITGGSNSTTSASAGSTTAIVTFSQTTTAHSSSRLSSTTLALDVTKSTTITSSATSTTSSTSTTAITTPQSTATTPTSLSSLPASSTTAANAVTTSNSAASSGARTTLASLGVASLLITLLV